MHLKGLLRYPSQRARGSLLIVALWMIMALAVLLVSMGQDVRQKISLADRIELRNWLSGVSETGIFRMLCDHIQNCMFYCDRIHSKRIFLNVAVGEATYTISYFYRETKDGELKVRYGMEDEGGKMNINLLSAEALSPFFRKVGGIDPELANEISYSIVDWRDPDPSLSHPQYGAEDNYYKGLETPYACKNYKFESFEELLLVRGMTPELFEKVRPFITIYGDQPININSAPWEVLACLTPEGDSFADRIMSFRAGADREPGTPDDSIFFFIEHVIKNGKYTTFLIGNNGFNIELVNLKPPFGVDPDFIYRVRSVGAVPRKRKALETEAILDGRGKILSWLEGVSRRMTPLELKEAAQPAQNIR